MKIQQDKNFYQNFFRIYVVLVLQNVITLSVNLADNMMLGSYNEIALSGVAAVNQIQFIYQQLLFAIGEGCVILGSQYYGKKDVKSVKKIASTAMHTGLVLSLVLFGAMSIFPVQAVSAFTTDEGIIAQGVSYLNLIRFTYLFFAITQVLLATLRTVEIVKIALQLSVVTFFVNCGINFVLIYGRFGMPELGVEGAAIGTLVARILECIILFIYIGKKETILKMRIADYLQVHKLMVKDYFKVTTPMLCIQGLWGLNTALQTVILGHMSSMAIAANSMAATLFLMMKSTAVGAASTASVVIGKAIGSGKEALVQDYAKTMQKLFLIIGICFGIALYFIRIPILEIYQMSAETEELANTFLIILSVVFVGTSYQMPTNNGIIRGGGSAMYVMKLDLISIWIIVIPLSFFMAFVVEASPVVVLCCLNADQIFKCVPAYIKCNHGNWIKKLTRNEEETS